MKGYRTLAINLLLAIAPVLQATGAADLGLTGNAATCYALFLTFVNLALRLITTTPVFTDTAVSSPKPPAALVLALLLPAMFALNGCKAASDPSTEYTIDSSVYTALTAEKVVLSRPCTAAVTAVCTDKALAQKMKTARTVLMTALKDYQAARDTYVAGGAGATKDAAEVAYQTLTAALKAANDLLALPAVQAITAKAKNKS